MREHKRSLHARSRIVAPSDQAVVRKNSGITFELRDLLRELEAGTDITENRNISTECLRNARRAVGCVRQSADRVCVDVIDEGRWSECVEQGLDRGPP